MTRQDIDRLYGGWAWIGSVPDVSRLFKDGPAERETLPVEPLVLLPKEQRTPTQCEQHQRRSDAVRHVGQ